MPHIVVKLYSGRTNEQKAHLAQAITDAVVASLDGSEASVSVAIQDVEKENWTEQVYKPEIMANPELLFKKPGYDPL